MGLGGSGVTWRMESGDLVVGMPASMLNGSGTQAG
jgi:hypothetical protein